MLRWFVAIGVMALCAMLLACNEPESEGKKFYRIFHERGSWKGRQVELEKYPLEQQYEIFLYGMNKVHPPDWILAYPIAKRGKIALDYVLEQLDQSTNEQEFYASIEIFRAMARQNYYPLCQDASTMNKILDNQSKILYPGMRNLYKKKLGHLKKYCSTRVQKEDAG